MSQQIDKTQMYEKRIPELLSFLLRNGHKGERGRIGVVGGCELYTGHMGFQFNVKRAKNLPRLSSEKNCIILFKLKTMQALHIMLQWRVLDQAVNLQQFSHHQMQQFQSRHIHLN